MAFEKEIKDEKEGKKHYAGLAKKIPPKARMFKSMSKDEGRHEGMLKKASKRGTSDGYMNA